MIGWLAPAAGSSATTPTPPRLAELRAQCARIPAIRGEIKDKNGRSLTYTEGLAGGWHYETGKPWPKHTRPHPLGEDYPE